MLGLRTANEARRSIDLEVLGEVALSWIERRDKSHARERDHYVMLSRAWLTARDADACKIASVIGEAGKKRST